MADVFDLEVVDVRSATPIIRSVQLGRAHGEPLPGWDPGAHIKVRLPDGDTRSYSLVNLSTDPAATTRPSLYQLGIRLETPSNGGSSFMHGLAIGNTVSVTAPSNDFRLEPTRGRVTLVAGGIGITPITSMLSALKAGGHRFQAFYAGRSREQLAFHDELAALAGESVSFHYDNDMLGPFDMNAVMSALEPDEPLYVCGPRAMIDAAIAIASKLGWRTGRLHFEIFSAAPPQVGDTPFEVELSSSGQVFIIPPDQTILDVLISAGVDPMYDCKRGDCGICQATVLDGEPDHRDYILSESERAQGKLIQICVSRSKSPRLVLDL